MDMVSELRKAKGRIESRGLTETYYGGYDYCTCAPMRRTRKVNLDFSSEATSLLDSAGMMVSGRNYRQIESDAATFGPDHEIYDTFDRAIRMALELEVAFSPHLITTHHLLAPIGEHAPMPAALSAPPLPALPAAADSPVLAKSFFAVDRERELLPA